MSGRPNRKAADQKADRFLLFFCNCSVELSFRVTEGSREISGFKSEISPLRATHFSRDDIVLFRLNGYVFLIFSHYTA